MKKMPRNRNILLILIFLGLILALVLVSRLVDIAPDTLPELPPAQQETPIPGQAAAEEKEPLGYVLAQADGDSKWIPLPTDEQDLFISMTRQDDSGISNTLRLMKNGFVMHSSTCENQDCVMQGEVTLENKDHRVLRNAVLCLPHNVIVELYSMEELQQMLAESAGQNP